MWYKYPHEQRKYLHIHIWKNLSTTYTKSWGEYGHTLRPDYGPSHQNLDEEEPINDEEDKPEDNDDMLEMPDMHGGIHLQLYDSDLENEDELEGIDGSSIILDVHARCRDVGGIAGKVQDFWLWEYVEEEPLAFKYSLYPPYSRFKSMWNYDGARL